jgi:hypothetical protein
MPIRFRCEHCQSRLSVSTRKAGARARCPQCGKPVTVPDGESGPKPAAESSAPPEPPAGSAPAGTSRSPRPTAAIEPGRRSEPPPPPAPPEPVSTAEPAAEPVAGPPSPPAAATVDLPTVQPTADGITPPATEAAASFTLYDDEDENEVIYEYEEETGPVTAQALLFDPTKVAVPRRILYLQGALLGLVAVLALGLGILIGSLGGGRPVEDAGPEPCRITGRMVLGTRTEDTIADQGAVAIVVPQDARPESKIELVGLRPQDPPPWEDHPGLRALHSIGGSYARADENGRFQVQVPDRGNYFLLLISANRRRPVDNATRTERAQLGRYFPLAPDMFGGYDYRWQAETIRRDREVNIVF